MGARPRDQSAGPGGPSIIMSSTSPGAWPESESFLKHIAYAGSLDEIPNHPESLQRIISSLSPQRRSLRDVYPTPDPPGLTTKSLACVLYQTGRHGPQNGFRLLLLNPGLPHQAVSAQLNNLGDVGYNTAEMVTCRKDGMIVVIPDIKDEESQTSTSYQDLIQPILENQAIPRFTAREGEITLRLRKEACYPRSVGQKPGPISQAPITGRGYIFATWSSTPDGSGCPAIVLVKEGSSPELAEVEVVSRLKKRQRDEACFMLFGKEGLEKVYE